MSIKSLVNMINTTTPYAWDDSLSVYEFLGKILSKLNEVVDEVNLKLPDDFQVAFYERFREYTKDEMDRIVSSGEFEAILTSILTGVNEFKDEIIDARHGEVSVGANIAEVKSKLAEIATNLKNYEYLVVDDDWSIALQKAHDDTPDGGGLLIPDGVFKVMGVNFYKPLKITCLGTLKPLTNSCTPTGYVLKLGDSDKSYFKFYGNLNLKSDGDWFTYSATGLKLVNVNESILELNIEGFRKGFEFIGDGYGACYNKFIFNRMVDNQTTVDIKGINEGWVNENTYFGGRFTNNSQKINYDDVLFFDVGETDKWTTDSNHFIHPSIEGKGQFFKLNGQGNKFENVRYEAALYDYLGDKPKFIMGGRNNTLEFLYDTFTGYGLKTFVYNASRISEGCILFSANIDLTGYLTNGRRLVLTLDDDSTLDVFVLKSSFTVGSGTTVYIAKDLPANRNVKNFKTLNYVNEHETNKIIKFRGDVLSAGNPSDQKDKLFYGNSIEPAIIFSDSNSLSDQVFDVNYLGASKAKMDFGGNFETKGSIKSRDFIFSNGNKFFSGIQIPTEGTYNRGDIIFNKYPSATSPILWYCISGGSPGSWRSIGLYTIASTTSNRPVLGDTDIGTMYFDTTINKPIFWTGSKWVDFSGVNV